MSEGSLLAASSSMSSYRPQLMRVVHAALVCRTCPSASAAARPASSSVCCAERGISSACVGEVHPLTLPPLAAMSRESMRRYACCECRVPRKRPQSAGGKVPERQNWDSMMQLQQSMLVVHSSGVATYAVLVLVQHSTGVAPYADYYSALVAPHAVPV
eukprot:156363-Rhodomonas_salina.1